MHAPPAPGTDGCARLCCPCTPAPCLINQPPPLRPAGHLPFLPSPSCIIGSLLDQIGVPIFLVFCILITVVLILHTRQAAGKAYYAVDPPTVGPDSTLVVTDIQAGGWGVGARRSGRGVWDGGGGDAPLPPRRLSKARRGGNDAALARKGHGWLGQKVPTSGGATRRMMQMASFTNSWQCMCSVMPAPTGTL